MNYKLVPGGRRQTDRPKLRGQGGGETGVRKGCIMAGTGVGLGSFETSPCLGPVTERLAPRVQP